MSINHEAPSAAVSEDQEALLREIMVAPRQAFVPLPDTEVRQRPGWFQLLTPSLRQGGLNEVALAQLDDAEADAVIDETLAEYQRRGLRMRWSVGPDSRPADLGQRLLRRGLVPVEVRGMYRSTTDLWVESDPQISVERVDEATVDEYTRTMAAGWETDAAPLDRFHRLVLAQAEPRLTLYLARCGGQALGAAASAMSPGSAYLMGAVVLPSFRGRGAYRALVAARLRDAAERGLNLATSQAQLATSAPILARLGFRSLLTFWMYGSAAA